MERLSVTKEEEEEKRKTKNVEDNHSQEAAIAIWGGLAAIALWLIVLATGSRISYFQSSAESFVYAFGISLPAIAVSLLALWRIRRPIEKEELSPAINVISEKRAKQET